MLVYGHQITSIIEAGEQEMQYVLGITCNVFDMYSIVQLVVFRMIVTTVNRSKV